MRGIDLDFSAETASLATAERLFGTVPPPLRRLGALKLGGHLSGDDARLALAVSTEGGPGQTALSGELAHEDGKWRLSSLHGTVAGTALRGEILAGTEDGRPSLVLRLEAGDIGLDRLWPEAPRTAPRRWSVDRLDFGWLGGVSGRLSLGTAGLTLRGQRLGTASLEASLENNTLTLERLEGELMGGRLAASGRLARTAGGAAEAALTFSLAGGRFERGFFDDRLAAETVDIASGSLDADASLTFGGDSELALIGSLAGSGHVAVGGGRLRGIDLPGLIQRIAGLRLPQDVDTRLAPGRPEPEGDTPFERLEGAFAIENGTIAAPALRLAAPSGSGEAEGTLDLPNRLLNLALHLRPEYQPPLPAIDILVTGSLYHLQRTLDTGALRDHLRKELFDHPPP